MVERVTLLQNKRIVLGVTGSIACYKAVDLASKLTQSGALVDVILTDAAQQFVTPLTFQAVTGRAVYTDLWRTEKGGGLPTHIAHVGLAEGAALMMVAPATADTLARLAHGFASDLLAITALALHDSTPILIAPAMDGTMYAHPAVAANLNILRGRGAVIIEPETGRFASGLVGQGRLPETSTLIGAARRVLGSSTGVLRGHSVVVTAGGTREALDPVRYITNRSSGKQGYALAGAALDAGADVTLITTLTEASSLETPYGATVVRVASALELRDAVLTHTQNADVLIMAAAVADFRAAQIAEQKIKKQGESDGLTLELSRNPDILAAVKARREETHKPRVVVGFAAESADLLTHAQDKLDRKGLDMLVANDITQVDAGFEVDTNRVILLESGGRVEHLDLMSKAQVSEHIIQRVATHLKG